MRMKSYRPSKLVVYENKQEFSYDMFENKDLIVLKGQRVLEFRTNGSFVDIETGKSELMNELSDVLIVIRGDNRYAKRIWEKSKNIN